MYKLKYIPLKVTSINVNGLGNGSKKATCILALKAAQLNTPNEVIAKKPDSLILSHIVLQI
ncbi:hypothetical protein [Candidatus Endomicrobiellum cubanum]|jgi:hypothetical protein|uniref:hypothetical protein n=1 Tax=Candidatus Endomicrobiellum cubanum TaxID=3242325 RepID=UPI003593D7FD